jgi:hypothetical protein
MADDSKDSLTHHADRSAQMREEYKEHVRRRAQDQAQEALQRAEQRKLSIDAQEQQVNDLIPPGTTRDQLLDRIRQMREEKVEEAHDYYISPEMQAQLELEQAEGRRMVALEEERQQRAAQLRALTVAAADQQGVMVGVHHPNPGMDEQFPAIKATLGKTSTPKQLK